MLLYLSSVPAIRFEKSWNNFNEVNSATFFKRMLDSLRSGNAYIRHWTGKVNISGNYQVSSVGNQAIPEAMISY